MWTRGLDAGHEDKRQRGMKFVDEICIQISPNSNSTRNWRRKTTTWITMRAEPEKEKIKEVLASTRLLGSNMQRMLNEDFTRSIHAESFSSAPKERLCWQDVREYVTSNSLLNTTYLITRPVLPRKPGTRRCLKTSYRKRIYSVPRPLQFVSLQNTD